MIIELNYNNAYKWFSDKKNYVIGYIYYNNKFYQGNSLLQLIKNIEKDDLKKFIDKIDGAFLFVINFEEEIVIVSDLLRSFPLFYKVEKNSILIFDNIMKFENKKINCTSKEEFLGLGYVTGDNTLFEDIFQIEGHQIITINKNKYTVKKEKYFDYKYNIKKKSKKQIIKELDIAYNNATKKMIDYLGGRTAIVPLSGGNDSRLLVYYLKKNNYDNIITYTYGNSTNSELETSKKVSEFLKVEWHFVSYENKSMSKKFNNKQIYKEMADYCGRGFSIPIIQEWEAITELIRMGIVKKESSVVIPGYSGDFIAGSHISEYLFMNEYLTLEELEQHIYKRQYQYATKELNKSAIKIKLNKILNIKNHNKKNKRDINIEIYEKFDFEERQTKYITNAVRTFDLQGICWYLPFWDKNLINKWLEIPFEMKYKISLFEDFTIQTYKDLMEYAPIYKIKINKKLPKLLQLFKYFYRFFDRYKNGFLNFYGYFYFRTYVKYFLKTRFIDYNRMFAEHYISYLKKELK